jgi:hypothetical protein
MPRQPSPRGGDSTPGVVVVKPAASSILDAVTDEPIATLATIEPGEVMARPASAPTRSTYRDIRLNPQFDRQREREEADSKTRADNRAAAQRYRRDRDLSAHPDVQGGRGATSRSQPYAEGPSTRSRNVEDPRRPIGGGSAHRRPKGRGKSKPTDAELSEQQRAGRQRADELNAGRN